MAKGMVNQEKQGAERKQAASGDAKKRGDDGTKAVGDNRRAGDLDGNTTGGDSKSPGATEATDESDGDANT